jgi:hypothetical protein
MKHGLTVFNGGVLAALVVSTAAVISCAQAPQNPPPPAAAVATSAADNGRFQIVVKPEAQNTSILLLLDTRTGDSWIYRPPQPPTFNGYWSDIPRMTYPPQVWQQAFQILFTPPTNAPAPAATTGGTTGGAARNTSGGTP